MKVERNLLKDISKIFMKMNEYATDNSSIYQEFEVSSFFFYLISFYFL